jgi:hypothetical protein
MSTHAITPPPDNFKVLGDLLHSLSQPLTTLHCAFESSLCADVHNSLDASQALEQTDRAIEVLGLIREYVEIEQGVSCSASVPVDLTLEKAMSQLSILAEARGQHLFVCGRSKSTVPLKATWLHRSLLYLLGTLIESEPAGRAITVLLEDFGSECVLSGHSFPVKSSAYLPGHASNASTRLLQARVEIARRALESCGALVALYTDARRGFTVRFPKPGSALGALSA